AAAGYAFYAVDLRAAGRSLRPGQIPHFVTDLREQATDIAAAARAVRGLEPGRPLLVHAHSTGGLPASVWAHAHRTAAGADAGPDLLVLDSPFLDLHAPAWQRTVGTRFLDRVGHLASTRIISDNPSRYAEHLLAANGGRWEFDTTLKRPEGLPGRVGWFVAVRRGQARVARGLQIACPGPLARAGPSRPHSPGQPAARRAGHRARRRADGRPRPLPGRGRHRAGRARRRARPHALRTRPARGLPRRHAPLGTGPSAGRRRADPPTHVRYQ